MRTKREKILRSAKVSIVIFIICSLFVCSEVLAVDYESIEDPSIFHLAKDHVYFEFGDTQFSKEHLSLDYIYVNDPGEEYGCGVNKDEECEFGVNENAGSQVCDIVKQSDTHTYFL